MLCFICLTIKLPERRKAATMVNGSMVCELHLRIAIHGKEGIERFIEGQSELIEERERKAFEKAISGTSFDLDS